MELIERKEGDGLAAIHASAFDAPWDRQAFDTLLASAGAFGFHQEDHGFILCRVAADEAEILTLAVRPERRGAGLATGLLASALAWAQGLACEAMFLEVAEDNAPALALYRSAGFFEVGRRSAYYARPQGAAAAALVMRRDLNR